MVADAPAPVADAVADAGVALDAGQAAAATQPQPPDPPPDPVAVVLGLPPSHSTSVGAPADGTVQGSVALPDRGPGFVHNDRRPYEARFGTVEMVQAIVRAAAVVQGALPGSGLVVNDIGLEGGGPIRQHGSHQSGRDADILFYYLDRHGEPMPAVGVPLDPTGKGWDFKDLSVPQDDVRVRIDVPRTWRFMAALLEVAGEQVQRIFIVEHVRTMLLDHARKVRAPADLRARFGQVACQPGTPHDDHMHVRFYCTPEDLAAGCQDTPPFYPWHRQALKKLGLEPVKAPPRSAKKRQAVKARTTTPAQARKRAGKMHWKVKEFLERRKQWQSKPSPGRPWCR